MTQTKLTLFPDSDLRTRGGEAALNALREKASVCQRCALYEGRTNMVFGEGNIDSPDIAFVGEGPGANEDESGRPFVGRAGQLLDQMIEAMGYSRPEVYICNVVNCRPPSNRKPDKAEAEACGMFLAGQLRIVRPKVVVALGGTAAQTLANSKKALKDLRGRWLEWKDKKAGLAVPMRATFHPAYLLRQPAKKADAWKDLQLVVSWVKGD